MNRRAGEWPLVVLLTPLLVLILAPFAWLIVSSLKSAGEIVIADPFSLPADLMWRNYVEAWQVGGFGDLIGNSLINLVGVIVLMLAVCAPGG
jgi:raffinose/stachyose/melibiose transport system permease protein